MSMSKKDFVELADRLRPFYHEEAEWTPETPEEILNVLVLFCRNQSPKFMESRWRDYVAGRCTANGKQVAR